MKKKKKRKTMKREYTYKDRFKLRPDFFVSKSSLDFEKEIDDEMYPVDEYRAKVLLKLGIPVYRFDILGDKIKRYKVRHNHVLNGDEYYGVSRVEWDAFIKSESSYLFVYLWNNVSSAANKIYVDKAVNDGRLAESNYNRIYIEESGCLENYFDERNDRRESEGLHDVYFSADKNFDDILRYTLPLLIEYASRLYKNEVYCGCDSDYVRLLLKLTGSVFTRLSCKNEPVRESE